MYEQVLNKVTPDYEDKIKMYKVDVEESPEVAAIFGARSLPYMIFISKDGNVSPEVGAMYPDQLKYRFDGLTTQN